MLWSSERRVFMDGHWAGQFQYLLIQHDHAFPVALLTFFEGHHYPPCRNLITPILILPSHCSSS